MFPWAEQRTKGPEGVRFSGAGAGEREGTDFMPFVDGGRERILLLNSKGNKWGRGRQADRPEREALGLLPFTQLKDCAFLSPLQILQTGPSYRAIMEMQL